MASLGGGVSRIPIVLAFVVIYFFLCEQYCSKVEAKNISRHEHLQMKAFLKSMNKPATISIQTRHGDIYDCIDIYTQPAFDHPLLKNHTIQMEPTAFPKRSRKINTSRFQNIGLEGGGCPNGTVPMHRIQMEDLLKVESLSHYGKKLWSKNRHVYAVTRTFGEFYGARAFINIWNPRVEKETEFSLSQLWLAAGPRNHRNTIEVGWTVYPKENGDSRTRLFVYWTADSYQKTGCYNMKCNGFVQLNSRIPVGVTLDQVSTYNGRQYEMKIDVFKDPKSGNWFLLMNDLVIGYWPSTLFNYLNSNASRVDWGGEVLQCPNCPFPEMGSGHFPNEGYGRAVYMRGLQVIDNNDMVLRDIQDSTIDRTSDCYDIYQFKQKRTHIFFGGPGGTQC